MKFFMILFVFFTAQMSFAKVKSSDFNKLIEKQAQSQSETHNSLKKEMELPLIEASESDKNKIIISSQQVHIDAPQVKKNAKKMRLSSSEQIEENDFSRLDQELGYAR